MPDRRPSLRFSASLALAAGSALLAGPTAPARAESAVVAAGLETSARHTKLRRSSPAADASLPASPTAITLWFTKPVQVKLTRIQLAGASGERVLLDAPRSAEAGDTVVAAALRGALREGSYTVTWATTSRDSHVIKGSYQFRVQGRAAPGGSR